MKNYFLIGFFVSAVAFSATAIQTDWSGGAGVAGPVVNWGNRFSSSSSINSIGTVLKLAGSFLAKSIKTTVDARFNGVYSVYPADVDGDGYMDMVGAAYLADEISWWRNTDGTGKSWNKYTVSGDVNGAISVYASDIDADGDLDIIGAAFAANEIIWWENTNGSGTAWTEHVVDDLYYWASSVTAADVNDDGKMDILGTSQHLNEISWWENTAGSGTVWTKHIVDNDFEDALCVNTADIDGDGDVDILGAAYKANDVCWWENTDGSGTSWTKTTIYTHVNGASSVCAADVDGDGDLDVLGAARLGNGIYWWENRNGSGSLWKMNFVDGNFAGAASVCAADIDADGDVDILGAGMNCFQIACWESLDGSGTKWSEHAIDTNFEGTRSVCAADLDGNGCLDVLGAAFDAGDIAWWDVQEYSTSASLESSILDVSSVTSWSQVVSNAQNPIGTSAGLQVRSSKDAASMGAWSDTLFSSTTSLAGILTDSTRYLQYRVLLSTDNTSRTAILEDVTFTYSTLVGVEENSFDEVCQLTINPLNNPSYNGCFSATITVPEIGMVELALYDVYGRIVADASRNYVAGNHLLNFRNISEGVYFCVAKAGTLSASESVIVLK